MVAYTVDFPLSVSVSQVRFSRLPQTSVWYDNNYFFMGKIHVTYGYHYKPFTQKMKMAYL